VLDRHRWAVPADVDPDFIDISFAFSREAGVAWENVGAALEPEGRLHLETYR
jgi:hypothetical protein